MAMPSYKFLFFVFLLVFPSMGYAQAMQNPMFRGVRSIEIACLFDGEIFDIETKDYICNLLIEGAADKIGLPALRNDEAKPDNSAQGSTIRFGYFWIEANFSYSDGDAIKGQLTWGNARPMRGVARSQSGDIQEAIIKDGIVENEAIFVHKLLDSMVI